MPLQIIRQDITKMQVDAIVNTTNEEMVGYSGVDLALHTAAGQGLDEECKRIAPLGLGEAKITGGYDLPCKYVIHTSGPIWRGGLLGESIILRSCYLESLSLAVAHGCRSVAVPLISSGVYGYPKDKVLKFAVKTITEFLYEHELDVILCVFDRDSYTFSKELFEDIREFIGDRYMNAYNDDHIKRYNEAPKATRRRVPKEAPKPEILSNAAFASNCIFEEASFKSEMTLAEYVKSMDKSFSEMLFELIDKSGMTDVECYKRANIDKRTFSKIKSGKGYKPSKQTVIAFAISLRLDLEKTQALLATVGFTLSKSNVFDKIIRYFIHKGIYDIYEINEALFEFDQTLLGC